MKALILRVLLIISMLIGFQNQLFAYITVPATSFSLEVGVDKYLTVPDSYYGYIDYAVWTCDRNEIVFVEKDAAGAIIRINKRFSGTAIIELLATEKYLDSFGRTRALTYYKQYLISCSGGGSGESVSDIVFPESVSLNVGETKQLKILSGECYNGKFSLWWKSQSSNNFVTYSINHNTGIIELSGLIPGEGILIVKTVDGKEKECRITVSPVEIVSDRRTKRLAIADIKSLVMAVLSLSNESEVKEVIIDSGESNVSNDVYDIKGTLIYKNIPPEDINSLPSGLYIIKGKKVLIQ